MVITHVNEFTLVLQQWKVRVNSRHPTNAMELATFPISIVLKRMPGRQGQGVEGGCTTVTDSSLIVLEARIQEELNNIHELRQSLEVRGFLTSDPELVSRLSDEWEAICITV